MSEEEIKCEHDEPKPTGNWKVDDIKSWAECTCKGWYETTLLKDNIGT